MPQGATRATPDEWDAERLYRLLEDQVVPAFYERDEHGIPVAWVQKMKHALLVAGQHFTARRMVKEYVERSYAPAMRGNGVPDDPPAA